MSKLAVLSCIASAAVLAACGGGGSAVSPGGSAPSGLLQGIQETLTVGMRCSEIMGFFPIDYATARSLVPPEYELVQQPTGQALLAMPIQDCDRLALNGSTIAGAPLVHFWIQVVGPEEFVEVEPGAFAKRDYYYSVSMQTTAGNEARQPVVQLGFEGATIDGMKLGDFAPSDDGHLVRVGGVVEKLSGDGSSYGYRWQELVDAEPTTLVPVVPVVHTFRHTKNDGKKAEADVRCMAAVHRKGEVQLTIDPRSEAAVFGSTLNGQSMDLDMSCEATMSQVK